MKDLALLGLRMLFGGLVVAGLAVFGETVKPKQFAGVFAAAPAVALASLLVGALAKGPEAARPATLGMMAGSVAFVAFALVAVPAIGRLGALAGSVATIGVWMVVASALYRLFLR